MSKRAKDSMDITGYGYFSDHMIESLGSGDSSRILYTHTVEKCQDILYSAWCKGSNHLFGCCGIKQGSWQIFNRPYAQQEYNQLALRIIDHMRSTGEWGEFFPASISSFGYNETIGSEAFPLTREEVEARGWKWYDAPKKDFEGSRIVPKDVSQYDEGVVGYETAKKNIDELLAGVIICEISGQPFRIQKEELLVYIDQDLPIPVRHPNTRYDDRIKYLSSKKIHQTPCRSCHDIIYTTHDPSASRKILCEKCFQKEVY